MREEEGGERQCESHMFNQCAANATCFHSQVASCTHAHPDTHARVRTNKLCAPPHATFREPFGNGYHLAAVRVDSFLTRRVDPPGLDVDELPTAMWRV